MVSETRVIMLAEVVGHFPRENVCKISERILERKETQFPSQTIDP